MAALAKASVVCGLEFCDPGLQGLEFFACTQQHGLLNFEFLTRYQIQLA
jgi:hypothetical protein